jgi:hypothetical protein
MSVSQVPLRPVAKGTLPKLWLAIAALVAIAFAIAYFGAGQFKTVTVDTVAVGKGPNITENIPAGPRMARCSTRPMDAARRHSW